MRQKHFLCLLSIGLCALLLISGCAKEPLEEITAAKTAVEDAKDAKADRFAPHQFHRAEDSLNAAMAEVKRQKAKTLMRDYKKARLLFQSVTELAILAKTAALSNPMKLKEDAVALVNGAETTLQELKAMLKANRKKIKPISLRRLKANSKISEAALKEAKTALGKNEFDMANKKARLIMENVCADKEKIIALTSAKKDGIVKNNLW